METINNQLYSETFIYIDESWEDGPTFPVALKDSCATFLFNSEDVVYIFGGLVLEGQSVGQVLSHVTEYIISEGTYNHVTDELPRSLTLHRHACTANVDGDGENVRLHT